MEVRAASEDGLVRGALLGNGRLLSMTDGGGKPRCRVLILLGLVSGREGREEAVDGCEGLHYQSQCCCFSSLHAFAHTPLAVYPRNVIR